MFVRPFRLLLSLLPCLLCVANAAKADVFDFSGVTVSGSYPSFSFSEATLGTVSILYDGTNHPLTVNPIVDIYGGVDSLMMGGGVDISWENEITSLDLRFYDLDLREFAIFTLETGVSLSAAGQLNGATLDIGNNTINATAADLGNGGVNNFTEVRLSGSPFTSFGILQRRPGGLNGASSLGFGNAVAVSNSSGGQTGGGQTGGGQTGTGTVDVNAPASLSLLGFGLMVLGATRRK